MKPVNRLSIILFTLLVGACTSNCGGAPADTTTPDPPKLSPLAACVDGSRAMTHIETILGYGERHAGTPGLDRTRDYIEHTLREMGLAPTRHSFSAMTPHPQIGTVDLANISADVGHGKPTVILSGHFDGKIIKKGTFKGANDGGSSTGLLLEMARCLKAHPPAGRVKLIFFDGEEALVKWGDADSLYGSKNFAAELAASGEKGDIGALVNIDMVADPNLRFHQETLSTPWVMEALNAGAKKIGRPDLFSGPRSAIGDDHVPFLELGIPSANVIDFHFGPGWDSNDWWHTENDDLAHISADSMTTTGRLVLETLPALFVGAKP